MNTQQTILAPDRDGIRLHLDAWTAPYLGTEYEDEPRPLTADRPVFACGEGQFDTRAPTLRDGRPNPRPGAGQPYPTTAPIDLAKMAADPPSVPKDSARWFIPSSYAQPDARSHAAQAERGAFWALVVDVDSGNPSLGAVEDALAAVLGNMRWLIYSSRSATERARKWRAVVPLQNALPGPDYADTQAAFFALLATEGLACDPALARPGQLIYAPNRGEFYAYAVRTDPPRLTLSGSSVVRQREADRSLRAKAEAAQRARAERQRLQRLGQVRDGPSPIEAFNAANPVPDLLAHYGYARAGTSCDWRSPMQTSKSHATRAASDWWVSLSASDASAGLGAVSRAGAAYGDAFDLFVHFEHCGNRETALDAVLAGLREGGSC